MPQAYSRPVGARSGIEHPKRLGITKAVITQQIAKIERAFETKQLVRTTRSVRTTDEGRATDVPTIIGEPALTDSGRRDPLQSIRTSGLPGARWRHNEHPERSVT